jgi:hypothetical protein
LRTGVYVLLYYAPASTSSYSSIYPPASSLTTPPLLSTPLPSSSLLRVAVYIYDITVVQLALAGESGYSIPGGIGLADVGRLLQTARDEGGVRTARRPAQPSGDVAALTITAGRCGHSNFGGSVNSLTRMCPLKPFHSVRI